MKSIQEKLIEDLRYYEEILGELSRMKFGKDKTSKYLKGQRDDMQVLVNAMIRLLSREERQNLL